MAKIFDPTHPSGIVADPCELPVADSAALGKLISSEAGYARGPKYGEVYTAPAGGTGYYAGYRSHVSGLVLRGVRHFATLKDAQDYAVQVSDY